MVALSKKLGIHYGWLIAFVSVAMIVCSTLFSSGMSICLAGVREEFGFAGTVTSMFVTIRSLSAFLIVLVMDVWFKKLGYRYGIALGVSIGAVGMFLFSIAGERIWIYYAGAALGGICYGLCMVAAASLLMRNWFNKYRGLVLGVCSAGTGISNMIFATTLRKMINEGGVGSAYFFQMIVFAVVALLALLIIRTTPEEVGLEPVGGKDFVVVSKKKANTSTFDHKVFLGPGYIWAMAFFVVLLGMASSPVSSHMPIALGEAGLDPDKVAAAASMAGFLMIIFKPVYGLLADKIGQKLTSVIYTIVIVIGYTALILPLWIKSDALSYIAYAGHGMGGAVCTLGYTMWAMEWSSKEDYPKTLKKFQSAFQLGTLIASPLPGIVFDITGSYCYFFIVAVLGYALSTGFAMVFYRILAKKRIAAGEPVD